MKNILDIIKFRVYSNLKADASRGHLGLIWWFIEPVLYMLAFYLVFAIGLRKGKPGFVFFLLSGLVPWKWFASNIAQGSISIKANMNIMRQVYIPKYVFIYEIVFLNTIKFLIVFFLLIIFLAFNGFYPSIVWLSLPFIVFVQMILIISTSGFIASILPLIPDLKYIVDNGLVFLLFASGIFFDIQEMPSDIAMYFKLNPVAILLMNYRAVLLEANWPDFISLIAVTIFSIILLFIAHMILNKYDRQYLKIT